MTKRILSVLLVLLVAVTAVSLAVMADDGEYTVKAIDNSDLDPVKLANGTQECPLCGKVPEAGWIALDQATYGETAYGMMGDNAHVYLTEDITYTGTSAFITAPVRNGALPQNACVHLNGHNLTSTQTRVFMGSSGILNVMGNGTVSGGLTATTNQNRGSTVAINTAISTGAVCLYGGTYVKAETSAFRSVVSIDNNGGRIRVYKGAEILCQPGENGIYVGTSNKVDSELGIYGGVVTGGGVQLSNRNTEKANATSFTMMDGRVDSGVVIGTGVTATLKGAPVISGDGLDLTSGVKISVVDMTDGADVRVKVGYGAFTQACDPAYAAYFTPTNSLIQIKSVGGALVADAKDDCTADEVAPLCDGKTLKLLAIGNSFSNNATKYLYDIAKAEGIENVVIGRLYIGGCSLETHAANAAADAAEYTYYKNTAGKWVTTSGKVTMLHGILDEDWDLITMQQASLYSGREETYNQDLRYLIDYVEANKTNPDAKLLWHMTWAYRQDSTKSGFTGNYENSQLRMYEMITECVRSKVIPNEEFVGILPVGTAIQNARSSYMGQVFNSDTSHLNSLGEVIAAYTWYAALTDKPLTELKITNAELGMILTAGDRRVIVEAVNNALEKPYEVTQSAYTKETDKVDNSKLVFAEGSTEAFCPVCNATATWTPITGTETRVEKLTDGTHLYLANTVEVSGLTAEFINAGTSGGMVCLHLNGFDLKAFGSSAIFVGNGTLNIMGEGTVSGDRSSTAAGSAIQINNTGAILNLYGGIYTKPATDTKGSIIRTGTSGGVINMYGPAVIDGANITTEKDPTCLQLNGNEGKPSTFNMYGGVIKDGKTQKNGDNGYGGNIRLKTADATFNMYGGTISGGYSNSLGGNLYITKGEFYLYGGTITDGQVPETNSNYGGNVFVSTDGTMYIYGGTITPGETGTAGRGVNICTRGTVSMAGGLITGGVASDNGGNVYMLGGTFTVRKGTVENGSAKTGGNFYLYRGELSVMTICTITGGRATASGGNIYATYQGKITMTSGKVTNGTAGTYGGNIAVRYAATEENPETPTVTFSGGTISGGSAAKQGGNVSVGGYAFTMSGGTISGGAAEDGLDNVYLCDGADMTMSGGKILSSNCSEDHSKAFSDHNTGRGLYIEDATVTMSGKAGIYNDQLCGNIYVSEQGKLTIADGWTGKTSAAWAVEVPPYGAAINENNAAATGSFTGTLVYDYDHLQPRVYAEEGKLMLPGMLLKNSDGTFTWYNTDAEALEAHLAAEDSHLQAMGSGRAFEIPEGKTLVLDVNGKQVTVTGSGTLRGMDSANDTYAVTEGLATVAETVTVEKSIPVGTGSRYLALAEENGYSFHRLDMYLTAVSLRTDACGLYYKAVYGCDDVLKERIDSYGVVLSTQDIPGADFMTEEGAINAYTVYDKSSFVSGAEVTSGSVFGIMKHGQKRNAQRGETKIYANAYMVIDGETLVAEGDAYSLLDVLKAIDGNWASYEASGEATAVKSFYQVWKDKGMGSWAAELPNIAG